MLSRLSSRASGLLERLSLGTWIILLVAAASSVAVVVLGRPARSGMPFWVFNEVHRNTYQPIVQQWNVDHPTTPIDLFLIQIDAYERRLLSGFAAGTPVGDLLETERRLASRTFLGPEDAIGYIDLSSRLRDEDLFDIINQPSFTPWTTRGKIYGLPHDVHPVLLVYRADLIEAAGIDLSTVETWDEFIRVLRPMMQDFDGDGRLDRFPLNGWPTNQIFVEGLLRQADGRYFDEDGHPVIDEDNNARTLATIISWTVGPDRICTDVQDQVASGHQQRRDGTVLCQLMPDWMVGQWKKDLADLGGKLKLMPLPAFTRGGRRTTVWGGTMLGISSRSPDVDTAWAFAKHLYLSAELAETTFRKTGIVTPVKKHWDLPIFAAPDPYFCGQKSGKLFIEQAPNVPIRSSSPYERYALERTIVAAIALHDYAKDTRTFTADGLFKEAKRVLGVAQAQVRRQMQQNVFAP